MNRKGKIEKRFLTPVEVAEGYGFSEGVLANMRWKKTGPPYYKVSSRKVLYLVEDVESWIRRNPQLTMGSIPEKL